MNEVAGPGISNINPARGNAGAILTLTGTHFGKTTTDNSVSFDGINVQAITASQTELILVAPPHAPGITEIKVMVNGKESRAVYFEYN